MGSVDVRFLERACAEEAVHLRFPMTAIGPGNVARYLAALGDSDWSKVDFSRFSKVRNPAVTSYDFSITALLNAIHD